MARIAYVDHSFHQKTLSTSFLPEILRKHGHLVDYFWDDSWKGGAPVNWDAVRGYDVVVMFQACCPIGDQYYRKLHPNVIFVPMLDQFGVWQAPLFNLNNYFEPLQGSKILSFSNAVHAMASGFGIKSFFIRYYREIISEASTPKAGLHGFFWLRRETEISWKTIRKLISGTRFDSFHLHLAHDPGTPTPTLPSQDEVDLHHITMSTWFEAKEDYTATLERANVFFAARMEEGVGQSFLEALVRGQCVVAPNQGTMNEYVIPGVNGLLYQRENLYPLNFENVLELGAAARVGAIEGRAIWERREKELVEYILTPSEHLYVGKYLYNFKRSPTDRILASLRYVATRYAIFRRTRFVWSPLKNALWKMSKKFLKKI